MQVDVRPDYEVYLRVLNALLIVHTVMSRRMQGLPAQVQHQWAAPILFVLPAYAIAIGVDVSDALPTVAWSAGVGVVLALVNFVDTLLHKPRWGEEAVTSLYAAVNCTLAGLFGMETAVPWYAALVATLIVTGMPLHRPHLKLSTPYTATAGQSSKLPTLYTATAGQSLEVTLQQHDKPHSVTVTEEQGGYVTAQFVKGGQSEAGTSVTKALAALATAHREGTWTIYQNGAPVDALLTLAKARELPHRAFVARQNNPGTLVF
jgi:hypothetical protein